MLDNNELITWRQLLWPCFYKHSFPRNGESQNTTSEVTRVLQKGDFYACIRFLVQDVNRTSAKYFPKESKSNLEWILRQLSSSDVMDRLWIKLISRQEALEKDPCRKNLDNEESYMVHNQEQVQCPYGRKNNLMKSPIIGVEWNIFRTVMLTHINNTLSLSLGNSMGGKNCTSENNSSATPMEYVVDPLSDDSHLDDSFMNLSRVTISMSSVSDLDRLDDGKQCNPEDEYGLNQELSLMLKTREIDIIREGFSETFENILPHMKGKPFHDTPRSVWPSLLNVALHPVLKSSASLGVESPRFEIERLPANPCDDMKPVSIPKTKPKRVKKAENKAALLVSSLNNKTSTLALNDGIDNMPLDTPLTSETGNTKVISIANNKQETQTMRESCRKFVRSKTHTMSEAVNPNPYYEGSSIHRQQKSFITFIDEHAPLESQKLERRWSLSALADTPLKNNSTQTVKGALASTYRTRHKPKGSVFISNPFKDVSTASSSGDSIRAQEQGDIENCSPNMQQSMGVQISPQNRKLSLSHEIDKDVKKDSAPIHDVIMAPPYCRYDRPSNVVVTTGEACPTKCITTDNSVGMISNSNGCGKDSFTRELHSQELGNVSNYHTLKEGLSPIFPSSQSPHPLIETDQAHQRYASQPCRISGSLSVGMTPDKCKCTDPPQMNGCKLNRTPYPVVSEDEQHTRAGTTSQGNTACVVNSHRDHDYSKFTRTIYNRAVEEDNRTNSGIATVLFKPSTQSKAPWEGKGKPPVQLSNRAQQRIGLHKAGSLGYSKGVLLNPPQVPLTRCKTLYS